MLSMSDVQKNKKESEAPRVEPKSEVLTLHNLPPRNRGRKPIEQGKDQILNLSDRRRRVRAQAKIPKFYKAGRGQGGIFAEWEADGCFGPPRFADCMQDGAWRGRRCFIIGGGPSVKRLDLSGLEGELTIGINRAYELLSPDILFGVDSQLFGWAELGQLGEESQKKFREYTGFKVWMALHDLFPDDIHLVEPDLDGGYRIGSTHRLAFKNNSGYGAINLAAALGASPIYLLGFDMRGNGSGKQKWWHNGYPMDYGEDVYADYVKELGKFAPVLEKAGYDVVNLNRKSALKCFKFDTLKKVLAAKPAPAPPAPWQLVSFYTTGTGYEQEIKKLESSLSSHNIPHHFFPCNPMGSWRANLNHKSEIMLKAFTMFPDKDIVFVDSDALIRKHPRLFDVLSSERKFDMAAHYHGYSTSVDGGSLLSGTLWFANNPQSKRLVKRWHEIGTTCPTIRHQHCLNIAIHELEAEGKPTKVFRLPKEYTQIFDYKGNKPQDAVIEHFQASRRLREQVGVGGPLMDSDSITR